MMNVLVLNCGSSSLKYRIIKMPDETDIVNGEAQRVGIKSADTSFITHTVKGQNSTLNIDLPTHVDAFKKVLQLIFKNHESDEDIYFDCIAHRYVNSGKYWVKTCAKCWTMLAVVKWMQALYSPPMPLS